MTLCEESRLPPSFRGCKFGLKDTMKMLVDMNSKLILSRTITTVTVIVDHDLLELCNGIDVESPLARIAVSNLKGQIMYFCRGGGWSY
jgi:vacuolar protein sorting-associated protein 13A/C